MIKALVAVAAVLAPPIASAEGIDVRTYGADPTGNTDSTAAFAAAIGAGARVRVPAGTYALKSIAIGANTILEGDGQATVLRFETTGTAVAIDEWGTSPRYRTICQSGVTVVTACAEAIVAPCIAYRYTSPVVAWRHRMSAVPFPSKSPSWAIAQSGATAVTATDEVMVAPFMR